MALQAVFAELAGMGIVYGVAITTAVRYRFHRRRFVARGTVQLRVRFDQRETRTVVIERRVRPE